MIGLTIGALASLMIGSSIGAMRGMSERTVQQAHNSILNDMQNAGLNNWKVEDVLSNMYSDGVITQAELNKFSGALQKLDVKPGGIIPQVGFGGKKTKELMDIYGRVQEYVPSVKKTVWDATAKLPEDVRSAFSEGLPKIGGPSAPKYFDTDFEGYQRDVDPRRLWTGQELAELHNLDYNINNLYDNIKAGTSATKDARQFQADQMLTTALASEGAQDAAYLNTIRDAKGKALQKGTTIGNVKANELLANLNKYATNVQKMGEANVNRFATVDEALRNDANAMNTALARYEQIGRNLAGTSQYLYANDAERFISDWAANARLYEGDQNLRGNLQNANANMNNAFTVNSAIANAARQSAGQYNDELYKVYQVMLNANQGNPANASRDFERWITNQNTGAANVFDLAANTKRLN